MKKLFKSTALLFVAALLTTSVFAADKNKTEKTSTELQNEVSFAPLSNDRGVAIGLNNGDDALVTISDASGAVLMKKSLNGEKGFVLNQLEEGDYTLAVTQNKAEVKQTVHVYYTDNNLNKAVYFVN